MIKRLTWFAAGAATGAVGAGYAKKKARQAASSLAPVRIARSGVGTARLRGRDVVDALREGRQAMRHREDELRARRDGRLAVLDDRLEPGEELLVDGRPVERGRIVVLRREA
jgi:hypothetical protein